MNKNDVHIVAAGCSFTANEPTWANYLNDILKKTLHIVAIPGTGNHVISTNCIRKVEELRKQGITNIKVIIQWSGVYRFDKLVDDKSYDRLIEQYDSYKWISDSAVRDKHFWPDYYKIQSLSQTFHESIENILRIQWYLKSYNISYIMFNAWDLFHCNKTDSKISKELILNSNQFLDGKDYSNINDILPKDICKLTAELWNMIDWSNYWTFENTKIKNGGMLQWIQHSLPKDKWYIQPGDFHPSLYAHNEFAKQILLPKIKDIL